MTTEVEHIDLWMDGKSHLPIKALLQACRAHILELEAQLAAPEAALKSDAAELLAWAQNNPERAVGQLMADWAQAGRGCRETFFSFVESFRFAKARADKCGPQSGSPSEKK